MATEEQTQEQNQDQNIVPEFTFKPVESTADAIIEDVVQIKEETKEPEKKESEDNSEKKEEEKVSEQKQEQEEEKIEQEEAVDLDENLAWNFIKEKKGLKFENIDDFLKSGEAKKGDPEFEKYQEYKTKTRRGFGDFLETQKDWSKETPEIIIKAALKLENPDLSSNEIDFLFDKDYSFDEEIDDDFDINSKKINLKINAKKALTALEKQKEDYLVPRGSEDENVPEVYKEAKEVVDKLYAEQLENEEISKGLRSDFLAKTEAVLNDKFEGFKFTIDGQEFRVKPEDIKQTKNAQSDIANFQKNFFDKENRMTDSEGYHKHLYSAMNPDKIAQHFFNLGKTAHAEQLEKESKNIDVKGEKFIPNPALESFTFKKV
jgi:hypothetical protein